MKQALFLLLFYSLSSLEYGFDVMGKSRLSSTSPLILQRFRQLFVSGNRRTTSTLSKILFPPCHLRSFDRIRIECANQQQATSNIMIFKNIYIRVISPKKYAPLHPRVSLTASSWHKHHVPACFRCFGWVRYGSINLRYLQYDVRYAECGGKESRPLPASCSTSVDLFLLPSL
jgi:hypothetical protein